ncbi:MAG: porin family protein [Devosia sp.]|nr:porin family protein [Devosia sp.]
MKMTGKLLLAAAAVAGFSGTAMAADLYVPPAQPAPVAQVPAATDWDGPYIGASVGYGWGTASDSTVGDSASLTGFMVGGQVGYNFHLSNNIVAGVEGDLNWNDQTGTFGTSGNTYRINWDGSARGRLGVDLDGILPYVEAGVAFANATDSISGSDYSNTHTGWTAGAGVEFKVADPISVNVEYRYSDYGSQTYNGNSVALTDNTVKAGINYHF